MVASPEPDRGELKQSNKKGLAVSRRRMKRRQPQVLKPEFIPESDRKLLLDPIERPTPLYNVIHPVVCNAIAMVQASLKGRASLQQLRKMEHLPTLAITGSVKKNGSKDNHLVLFARRNVWLPDAQFGILFHGVVGVHGPTGGFPLKVIPSFSEQNLYRLRMSLGPEANIESGLLTTGEGLLRLNLPRENVRYNKARLLTLDTSWYKELAARLPDLE